MYAPCAPYAAYFSKVINISNRQPTKGIGLLKGAETPLLDTKQDEKFALQMVALSEKQAAFESVGGLAEASGVEDAAFAL